MDLRIEPEVNEHAFTLHYLFHTLHYYSRQSNMHVHLNGHVHLQMLAKNA